MSQRKIKHHYVPVMHLQRFADEDGLVWVFDRKGRFQPRRDTPRNVANEKFLYAPGPGAEDPASDVFEDWLAADIDGPAAPVIAQVVSSKRADLDRSSRSRLAAYLAAQDLRTPKQRDFLLQTFQDGLNREWPDVVRAALEALGEDTSPDAVASVAAEYEVTVNKSFWLDFIGDHVNKAGERLFKMAWCVIEAPPSATFILGDTGVVKFAGGFHQPVPHMPGWWPPITHWVLPLSSTLALGVSPERGFGFGTAKGTWIELVNQRIVLDAHDFVFAAERRSDIPMIWQQPR